MADNYHKDHFEPEKVAQVLIDCGGIKAVAAKALGCSRQTIYNYIEKYEMCADAVEEGIEIVLDKAEYNLVQGIADGHEGFTKYYLNNKGARRGYGFRPEANGAIGGPDQAAESAATGARLVADRITRLSAAIDARPLPESVDGDEPERVE
jgi:AcrR family transcriptional regulator